MPGAVGNPVAGMPSARGPGVRLPTAARTISGDWLVRASSGAWSGPGTSMPREMRAAPLAMPRAALPLPVLLRLLFLIVAGRRRRLHGRRSGRRGRQRRLARDRTNVLSLLDGGRSRRKCAISSRRRKGQDGAEGKSAASLQRSSGGEQRSRRVTPGRSAPLKLGQGRDVGGDHEGGNPLRRGAIAAGLRRRQVREPGHLPLGEPLHMRQRWPGIAKAIPQAVADNAGSAAASRSMTGDGVAAGTPPAGTAVAATAPPSPAGSAVLRCLRVRCPAANNG